MRAVVITTSDLHEAFSDFTLYLRGRVIGITQDIAAVESRISLIEQTGAGEASEYLRDHILNPEPHPAYDQDLPNLSVIFDNVIS